MERKVGEIFEYNGEWYQCVEGTGCYKCAFYDKNICIANNPHCTCRSDKKNVIFKKLEKVGEPEIINGKKVQSIVTGYVGCAFCIFKKGGACLSGGTCKNRGTRIYVEIKQNKEDMEEKKLTYEELEHYYDSTCGLWAIDRDPKQVTLEWIVENAFQLGDTIPEKVCASNLKPFDLEAAKAGKPICTRDGRKARIICFDRNWEYPIVALIECENGEEMISACDKDGKARIYETQGTDLMMLPQKKEGWIIIHKEAIYDKETAEKIARETTANVIRIQKIEWEE